jgi:hypothetical protein
MKTTVSTTFTLLLGILAGVAQADLIRLNDGTTYEGELAPPATVLIKTASGDKLVSFAQLPPDLQAQYWKKPAPPAAMAGPVQNEELAALAASVNLKTWSQVTAYGSFRDKPEKRGTGGLVVTKAFNAIEENWEGVYPVEHALVRVRHWQDAIDRAKLLMARPSQFLQKRWLESFLSAAEAVQRMDSAEFARNVRILRQHPLANDAFALAE